MSRLYLVSAKLDDIAACFDVGEIPDLAVPEEVVEGRPGLVIFERQGRRVLRAMPWGFPRHTREMRARGEPAGRIGLVADLTNPMWDTMVADRRYRCLIPLTHFANPDGDPGEKTRTWFSVKDRPIAAWAGFCRNLPEIGPVFAGMTMQANAAVEPYNDRMPVLLDPKDQAAWFEGTIRDVIRFQFQPPIAAERIKVVPTEDLWRSGAAPPDARPQLALL